MQQKGLLYHKAKLVFIDYYRKHTQRRPDIDFTDELPEPVLMPAQREPESFDEDATLSSNFWELFHPDEYEEQAKIIFWLHERYGYTMIEISQRLGISKSTAHDKLIQLKAKCRARLDENLRPTENHA